MKKPLFVFLAMMFSISVMAQQRIQLRSVDRSECVRSDMTSLKASFSFSTIEAEDYSSDRGTFSWLSLPNTVLGGNVGEPQIPVVNQLIAVPFGANPRIEITSYSTTDYRLADYDMRTLVPRQLPVRKNQNPDEVPFVMNEADYQTRGLRSEPIATVSVDGTMRGIQLGTMTIEPVSYDPMNNTIRVFNDIEVTVHFDGADVQATEDMLLKTYSPAFEPVYAQLFNGRAITDVYTDHPDLYNTPVRMLVICYSGFKNNSALNSWLQWKLQKGYYVDIFYTNETGTTASNIKNFIKTKYNASVSAGNAYTYLIVIGDTGQVPQYMTKTIDSSIGECASDLGYSSVNFTTSSTTNYFPDMYYSRMSVENTTHLTNYINKVLTYEKFEFADGGNYLNNVILVGGWDSNWTSRVAKPTINYATNNYFNSSNTTYGGFSGGTIHATISTSSTQGWSGTNHGCYNGLNDGVCFLNYTAHGDKQEWQGPQFTAKQVEGVTNTGKYFFGVGNCCLTGNYNLNNANYSSSYAPSSSIGATASFGETMIRVPNAGAIAYVGCSPYSYWYEDFYWAVGAHSYSAGNAPSVSSSTKGVYDIMFNDQYWNSASALLYLGNLAVQQAVTSNYTTSGISGSGEGGDCNNSAHYYFQFYHTFGDGSIMPYITKPETNTVTIPDFVTPGTASITVNALAGSYVAVTDNSSVIYGVAEANSSGVATVNFTNAIPGSGTLYVVVTRQQYQPYFGTIQIVGGTQYNIYVTQPQHGTISAPTQAYANTTVTLEATPETGYCLSSWTVKKGNTNITVTNNQFTMPEGDVTVTATFVQGLAITLASMTHGSISADPLYALQGMTINLTATPAEGYEFDSWVVYKTGDPNITVTVSGNSFIMPNYPVTVSANFVLGPTELTVYDGTGTNQYIPMYGYYFDNYAKSEYIIPASQLTAMAGGTISAITFYPYSVATTNSTWENTNQTIFLKEVSGTNLGGSFSGTSGATTVKVSSPLEMPTAGTAYTITFDTPYTYNGGNLLIGVYNTAKGSYNKVEWYGTSNLTSGVSAYGNNSGNLNSVSYNAQTFLPKTTFTYIPIPNEPVTITVSANPMEGGSVTGAGTYDPGTTATLTATANEGYTFTNWTKNGVVMSTNATYSFTVSNAASYVANFTLNSYMITATANLSEGGTVTVGSSKGNRDDLYYDFEDGWQGWTILQGSTSTSPNNWHHNTTHVSYSGGTAHDWSSFGNNSSSGFMMSESYISATSSSGSAYGAVTPDNYLVSPLVRLGGSISFYAGARNSDYCAEKFSVMVSTTDNTNTASFTTVETWILSLSSAGYTSEPYTVDLSAYSGMGYIAIRHFDCYDQWVLCIDDITIVEGSDGSTSSGNFNYGETCVVTATPQGDYHFVNWTENGTVVSSEASYSFTVTGDRDFVANFQEGEPEITQTSELAAGLNWWTANVGITLADLEAALGTNGLRISDNAGNYVTYNAQFGWSSNPNFTELVPGRMYKIKTSADCNIELTGVAINPTEVTITLNPGTNWIGFMGSTSVAVADALAGLTPTVGDVISGSGKSYAKYSAYGWGGTLETLVPGEGYIYTSKASTSTTFTYSVSKSFDGKDGGDEDYHWTAPNSYLYTHRNRVTYQVKIDGEEQHSHDIEVAAFIDNEVRGTVRLIEPYPIGLPGEYYIFLTIFGNSEDVGKYFTFKAYNHATDTEYNNCELSLVFSGEEEYDYGDINQDYYIDFVTIPTWTLEIEAYTETGGWYLITTPLAESTDVEFVQNMTANTFDLYRFNQAADLEWENWKNNEVGNHYHFSIEPGKGYLYANSEDVDLVFTGFPTNETTKSIVLNYDDNANLKGYNLVGNPFGQTAYIDNNHDYYRMNDDHTNVIQGQGNIINLMEGILVIATDANDNQVTFTTTNPNTAKSNNSLDQGVVINLVGNNGNIIDRATVRFNKDRQLPKYMLNTANTNISIPKDNKEYAIVKAETQGETPFNFRPGSNGSYTLRVNTENLEMGYLHLIDNMTGMDIDLLSTPSYTFNARTTDYESRFKLVFATGTSTEDDNFAFISNGNFIISNDGEATLQVIDVNGRILSSESINGSFSKTINAASGVYMLRLINGENVKVQKVVVR